MKSASTPNYRKVNGIVIFDSLPPGTRQAVWDDFLLNDKIILDKPYIIQSIQNPNEFEGHRTKRDFTAFNDFFSFLTEGNIYVFDKPSSRHQENDKK